MNYSRGLLSLPIPAALILFGYLNYTGVAYYFQIENSAATYIYFFIAYGWAIICTKLSRKFQITSLDTWVGILITIIALGYFENSGISKQLLFVALLGLNYVIGRHIRYEQLSNWYKFITTFGILTLALSIPELPKFFEAWQVGSLRPALYGGSAYASAFAYSMGLLLLAIVGWWLPSTRSKSIPYLLVLLLSTIIIYSSARIAILSCATAIVILLYYHESMSPKKKLFFASFGVVLALTIWTTLPQSYKEFNSLTEDSNLIALLTEPIGAGDALSGQFDEAVFTSQNTVSMRIEIIRSCLVQFLKHPIFGYGPDTLIIPHNSFLQVLFEHGIFAGVILGSIWLRIIFRMFQLISSANRIVQRHLVLLISMFIYMLLYSAVMGTTLTMASLFLLMGIIVSTVTNVGSVSSNNSVRKNLI
jgi:O-antigen ligase